MGYSDKVKEIADGSEIQSYGTTFDSGEWKNDAKDDHHLTIVDATVETADPPGTDLDSYVNFDGVDDIAYTAHDPELDGFGSKNVSFGLFVNTKDENDFWDVLFGKGPGGYEFRFHDTDTDRLRFNPDANNAGFIDIPHGFHDEWVFYVFTWDQSDFRAYRRRGQDSGMQSIGSESLDSNDWLTNSTPFKVAGRGTVGNFERSSKVQIAGLFSMEQVLTTQEMDEIYEAKDAPAGRPDPIDLGTENVDQYEVAEFTRSYDGYSGNPFDIIATVVATHTASSEERTFEMFYDGDWNWRTGQKGSVDEFKIRFANGLMGEWTFETFSNVTELDNLRGTINVSEQTNAVLARGPIQAGANQKWIEKETGKVLVPAFVINGRGLSYYWDDSLGEPEFQVMDDDIALFIVDHKLTGLEMEPTFSMFDPSIDELDGASGIADVDDPDLSPSIDSFRIMETLIQKCYEAGGYVHLWQFGGGIDHNEGEMSGGYNGSVHNRINRYYASRFGALAGWNMSAGWDVWDSRRTDDDVTKFATWVTFMQDRLLLGQMVGGRWHRNNQAISNWPQTHGADWVGSEDHELLNWNSNVAYDRFVEWLNSMSRPLFNEDRERRGYVTPWPSREYEFPRGARVNWHTYMAGGIAQIIAQLDPEATDFTAGQSQKSGRDGIVLRSFAFDEFDAIEKQTLVIWRTFIEEFPLTTETDRDNSLTNQFGLFTPVGENDCRIIAYREVADSVDVDLTSVSSITKAVAVDAHGSSYNEIDISGSLTAGQPNTWTAPDESDWVIAVEGELVGEPVPPTGVSFEIQSNATMHEGDNDNLMLDLSLIRDQFTTGEANDFWETVSEDGGNIRVYHGSNGVAREVVAFDKSEEEGFIFFDSSDATPGVSNTWVVAVESGQTEPDRDDPLGMEAVWGSYVAVWHLQEVSTGTADEYKDSSPNRNHGVGATHDTGLPTQVDAPVGKGIEVEFPQYVEVPDSPSLDDNYATLYMSALVKDINAQPSDGRVLSKNLGASSDSWNLAVNQASGPVRRRTRVRISTAGGTVTAGGVASDNTLTSPRNWLHYAGNYDGSLIKAFVDGEEASSTSQSGSVITDGSVVSIGSFGSTPGNDGRSLEGSIAEVRVRDGSVDEDFVETEKENILNNSGFWTLSDFAVEEGDPWLGTAERERHVQGLQAEVQARLGLAERNREGVGAGVIHMPGLGQSEREREAFGFTAGELLTISVVGKTITIEFEPGSTLDEEREALEANPDVMDLISVSTPGGSGSDPVSALTATNLDGGKSFLGRVADPEYGVMYTDIMPDSGSLTGTIRDSENNVVEGVDVIAIDQTDGTRVDTVTDVNGEYVLSGLNDRLHKVLVYYEERAFLEAGNVYTAREEKYAGRQGNEIEIIKVEKNGV